MPHAATDHFAELGPWPAGSRVAIGFSGGADSVFLALAWRAFLRERLDAATAASIQTSLWVVDHGHHEGSRAAAEAAAARGRALGLGPVRLLAADLDAPGMPPLANEQGLRWRRYEAFARAAADEATDILLLGHQADDQAETVLMRILRGTGVHGLAGIPARRMMARKPDTPAGAENGATEVRRPLLRLRRAAIRERLRAAGEAWLDDPSNALPDFATRNGVRLRGLPALAPYATGDPVQALNRLQREAAAWKEHEASTVVALLETAAWREAAGPMRRGAIRVLLQRQGCVVSPARLADLEGALLRRGSAHIDERLRLTVRGGPLRCEPRLPAGGAGRHGGSPGRPEIP